MVNQRLRTALESHTVSTLRQEVIKAMKGLGGASSMKKAQLVAHMLKFPSLFSHIRIRKKTVVKRVKYRSDLPPFPIPGLRSRRPPPGIRKAPRGFDKLGLANFGLGLARR